VCCYSPLPAVAALFIYQVTVAVLVDCFVDASNAADKAEADTQLAEYRESRQVRIFPLLPLIAHASYEPILSCFLSARDSKDKSKFRQKSRL
jgi:hypothetical protein